MSVTERTRGARACRGTQRPIKNQHVSSARTSTAAAARPRRASLLSVTLHWEPRTTCFVRRAANRQASEASDVGLVDLWLGNGCQQPPAHPDDDSSARSAGALAFSKGTQAGCIGQSDMDPATRAAPKGPSSMPLGEGALT